MPKIDLPAFPVEGGCTCGALRYRLKGAPLTIFACHCLECQRQSGGDYGLSMFVRRGDFEVLRGTAARFDRRADSGRVLPGLFCAACGTRVWHEPVHSPDQINIKPGTLDDPSWAVPVAHIWIERKKSNVRIDADALAMKGQPADRKPLYSAWARAVGAGA